MVIPYFVRGAIFAPTLVILIFFLKVTCPVPLGSGCFADLFNAPIFLPLALVEKLFGPGSGLLRYEMLFVLAYWSLIGLLVGLCFDLYKKGDQTEAQ